MELSMVTIGALLLDVILTGDGKDQVRFSIQPFMLPSSSVFSLQKKENFKYFAIFMDTVDEKTFSCTAAMSQANQKTHVCFPSSCHRYVLSLSIIIQDSETRNQKSQQQEWLFLTN
jgi:hypothetical protein